MQRIDNTLQRCCNLGVNCYLPNYPQAAYNEIQASRPIKGPGMQSADYPPLKQRLRLGSLIFITLMT